MSVIRSVVVIMSLTILSCLFFSCSSNSKTINHADAIRNELTCFNKSNVEKQAPSNKQFSIDNGSNFSWLIIDYSRAFSQFSLAKPFSIIITSRFSYQISLKTDFLSLRFLKAPFINFNYIFSFPCQYYVFALRKIII